MKTEAIALLSTFLVGGVSQSTHAQSTPTRPNPFAPPQARVVYAPDREYDLQHVAVDLTIDYPKLAFQGVAVNTLAPLRSGLATITLHCGKSLNVASCQVAGKNARFVRDGERLKITVPPAQVLAQNKAVAVMVRYSGGSGGGGTFGEGGGFHWIKPTKTEPNRVGFWTQGETEYNRDWAPTWDYPNDFATSETRTTVREDWEVIGNGVLAKNTRNAQAKTRTFHWQMKQPHATYLLSLVGGPLDIKTARWGDLPLRYVVPRGKAALIEPSFGDTPDMLQFFTKTTGVRYPWPQYAQSAMYDFGGGMENISATTLGERSLTDAREGFRRMAGLNAHELAHQWFGDLVTCKDWGHIWLNESFATFFQALYFEHSRGKTAYEAEIEDYTQEYLEESRNYKRPLATNVYADADDLFDSHAYPKGATILHTLRRQIGDPAFFAGIRAYLTKHRHTPVTSHDLCQALTESSGTNLLPFFDQWVYQPGHPVLAYAWRWADAEDSSTDNPPKEVVLTVRQTQDTKDGTPIYDLPATIGVIAQGKLTRHPVRLHQADQEIRIATPTRPDAVLLDPDHDFLREIPLPGWAESELPHLLQFAPCGVDRKEALRRLLDSDKPSDAVIALAAEAVRTDKGLFPALGTSLAPLAEIKRESLRPLFHDILRTHASFERRGEAIKALGELPKNTNDIQILRALVNDREPYAVVVAAVDTLATWDAQGNLDVLKQAARMSSRRETIREAAFAALAKASPADGVPLLLQAITPDNPRALREAGLRAMGKLKADEPRTRQALQTTLKDPAAAIALLAARAIAKRKDKTLLPALRELQNNPPADARRRFKNTLAEVIDELEAEKGT